VHATNLSAVGHASMPEPLRSSDGVVTAAAVASSPDRHETITMASPVTSNDLVTPS
jgi:hypothetical protein